MTEEKYEFSLIEQLEHPERSLPFREAQLRNEVDALADVLRRGIGSRFRPPHSRPSSDIQTIFYLRSTNWPVTYLCSTLFTRV